jgi:hypothetical protein
MRRGEPTEKDSERIREEEEEAAAVELKRQIFLIRIEYQVRDAIMVLDLPDPIVAACLRALADGFDPPGKEEPREAAKNGIR